jgi:hypothetical protein
VSPPTGSARASHSLPPAAQRAADAVGPPASHSQGLTAVVGESSMSAATSHSSRMPGTFGCEEPAGCPECTSRARVPIRTVHTARDVPGCPTDFNDERILRATALGSYPEQRFIQPAEIRPGRGGAMRTRALLAAPTIAMAIAATPPATAGGERAVGSRGRQFIDKDFKGPQLVSAGPDGSGLSRLTDPSPDTPMISPDGSQGVVDRWQSACLLEQHPRGVSCVS